MKTVRHYFTCDVCGESVAEPPYQYMSGCDAIRPHSPDGWREIEFRDVCPNHIVTISFYRER